VRAGTGSAYGLLNSDGKNWMLRPSVLVTVGVNSVFLMILLPQRERERERERSGREGRSKGGRERLGLIMLPTSGVQ
jgi:hypothetical protein